jgi:putative heme-binding domain-containing protein
MKILSEAPACGAFLISRTLAVAIPLLAALSLPAADNPFADIVRKTEPLTPEQEQKAFHLPPGFEIELVAAEPEIGKPINMAFDAQGRLWITQSREYPFPAPEGQKPRDAIKILNGVLGGGRARNITTFADGLNIPIGIYPYRDGAIGYSIPYIYSFRDTNGDGVADVKEPFLGRFGYERDTHGMTSSFRRGYDGWLYANHGFNNTSTLTAKDGSSIQMQSGNTYRVKVDGSHIEQFVWGRVNPFGLMFDPLGNIYSSDCETMPIYQLLRGAYYPSFGKPHDGLGFAPAMMNHKHGSTAIAGIVYYAATNFPEEFRDNIFVGNVMTCRIDRDSLVYHGSSPEAKEEPDFLATDDPWFRPVDIQLGPDGAIYVADFYNRIIGHYEVPLDHPGRDRERGRIWRITYRRAGVSPAHSPASEFNLAKASVTGLIRELGNPNITVRMLAMSELTDRIGASAIQPVTKMLRDRKSGVFQKIHGLWVLHRLGGLDPQLLAAAAHDPDRVLRVHAMRIFSELQSLTAEQHALVLAGLRDPDALVERAAADALGLHPQLENVRPLLDARHRVPAEDTHLLHVIRMALRDQLRSSEIFSRVPLPEWSDLDEKAVADVCPGLPTADSARFLLKHLQKFPENRETSIDYLRHAARYLPESEIGAMADFTRAKFADDLDFQLALFKSVREGMAQRGASTAESLRGWAMDVAARLVAGGDEKSQPWFNTPVEGTGNVTNPWLVQERASADGDKTAKFLCSLPPGGEQLTGILRSQPFTVPARLDFFVAGHDGYPNQPAQKKNVVRLRAADTREVLAETYPPRNDIAQPVSWDLSAHAGRKACLEIVDGDNGKAYAWLAVGRFDPEVVKMPAVDPRSLGQRWQDVAEVARSFKLTSLEAPLAAWLADKNMDPDVRAAAARAVLTLNPDANVALAGRICGDAAEPAALRQKTAEALAEANSPAARTALIESLCAAPERLQVKMALALAGGVGGAETLLQLTEAGKASPRLLLERSIKERLRAAKPGRYNERVEKLTKGLAPANEQLQKVIDQRHAAFDLAKASAQLGAMVFAKNCVVCHSMDNQGGAVGPHLDGVGNRGLERLLEDVLDPNRIVDPGFRYSIVSLKDGEVVTGLLRREEGEVLVFADATGKEISVPKKDIESKVESQSSLMPDNFSELIPAEDLNNLMAFLLSKGASPPPDAEGRSENKKSRSKMLRL